MTEIEKQEIEEMARLLKWGGCPQTQCPKNVPNDINVCNYCTAILLHKAGYRKQSETVREIYNKIYDNLPQACDWSWAQGAHWAMQIAAEFGKEDL